LETVDEFLADYETARGSLVGDLDRCLAASYALGVMRRNLDAIWGRLAGEAIFASVDPRNLFEECVAESESETASLQATVGEELHKRGWLSK